MHDQRQQEPNYHCVRREVKDEHMRGGGHKKNTAKLTCTNFSGAGKTVSAKYIMRYFATADDQEAFGKQAKGENMTEVEEQILGTVVVATHSLIFTCCTDQ